MTARFFGAVLLTAACALMMALTGCSAEPGRDGRDGVAGPQGPQGPKGDKGDPGESTGNASGTRLKARYASTADGARIFLGWYDEEIGDDCNFYITGKNIKSCLPATTAPVVFIDENCTKAFVRDTDETDGIIFYGYHRGDYQGSFRKIGNEKITLEKC